MLERVTESGLLALHQEVVRPEWIDYNGHMNVAYFLLTFDHATDAFFDYVGLDEDYRRRTGGSTFAVESHITYRQEVAEGDLLRFTTQLLGYDDKRLHYIHHMYQAEEGFLAAACEWLSLHVDLERRRVSAFPEEIARRLAALAAAQAELPLPEEAGQSIRIPEPKAR